MPSIKSLQKYCNRRLFLCIVLGFTSGLPLFVLLNLVQAWMRSEGVDLKSIGLFTLIQFPYTWKFVWAPFLDRFAPRLFSWKPGRRKSWMFMMQIGVALCIAGLGWLSPLSQLTSVVLLSIALAFFSASLDTVIDAYRRELLKDNEQGLGTSIHVNAYKISGLIPGSLSLILADHLPWQSVFAITAAFMLPGILMSCLIKEPRVPGASPKNLREAIVLPFKEFIGRNGWKQAVYVLAFMLFYKLGDNMATSLATAFYIDLGFTKTQIGVIAKSVGLWSSIFGGLIGGALLIKLGTHRGLWLVGFAQAFAILSFAWLALAGNDVMVLAIVIGLEAFAIGLGTAAFVAYIASITDTRYTATQFALFTSLASIPRSFINAASGYIVEETGWVVFFVMCFVMAVPGMLLLFKVAPWGQKSQFEN